MRAYLTVIRDSFHEAFASRVLYLLLLAMTLVLAAMAPLGYREQRILAFQPRDIYDWPIFLKELQRQAQGDARSPGKRIADLAGKPLATLLSDPAATRDLTPAKVNEVVEGLNSLLSKSSLYDADAWQSIRLRDTTKELLDRGPAELEADDLNYLNRLLLRDAFPAHLGTIGDKQLHMTYAWWTVPEPVPGGLMWFPQVVRIALAAFMNLFVGTVAVFVAVLVTAPIIPRTFEPGAIDLLLSKPISRSLLVIAKYVGGCAFIFVSAGYFIVGLWLIIGLRLDVWSGKLLLCVPIFMFQFAIYYVISLLAGVIWRNAIVCIVATVLFYLACFTVGNGNLAMERTYIVPNQLVGIVPAKDGIVCATRQGQFVQWNDVTRSWSEVLRASDQRSRRPLGPSVPVRLIGPVYHRPSESLIYVKPAPQGPPRRFLSAGSEFVTAKYSGSWVPQTGAAPPSGTSWMFLDADSHLVLVASTGLYAYQPGDGPRGVAPKIFGIELPLKTGKDPFSRVGPPEEVPLGAPYAAAIDRRTNRLLVDTDQSLMLLARGKETPEYQVACQVPHKPEGPTLVGLTGDWAIVATKAGAVELRRTNDLTVQHHFRPAGDSPPRAIETSEDERFVAVLFHSGVLWLFDLQEQRGKQLDTDATAITFDADTLISADSMRRVVFQKPASGEVVRSYDAEPDTVTWYYTWLVHPLYTLFPKPGELGTVVSSLLIDDQAGAPFLQGTEDLRDDYPVSRNSATMFHGAIFIVIVLGIACLYVERVDL